MIMRNLYTYFLFFAFAVTFLAGCDRNRTEPFSPEAEPCDLILDLVVPQISLGTKSQYTPGEGYNIVDDPFSDPSGWTAWERALDGQGMYRMTVFLINKSEGGKLVGYRNIYYTAADNKGDIYAEGSDEGANGWVDGDGNVVADALYGNRAKVSFLYDHPVHKNASGESPERLVRGNYRIVAFANCSACPEVLDGQPGSTPYGGMENKSGTKITTFSEGIMEEFNNSIDSYPDGKVFSTYAHYGELHNWMLEAALASDGITSEYLCKPTPMPLTLVEDIELQPGLNKITGNLLRARSRIRIAIENNADYELTVHDLVFSSNFSKENSYLFDDPDNPGRVYDISGVSKGAPNSKSDNALVSFVPDMKVPARSTALLFDGYVLESRDNGNPYTYTLDLEYVGADYNKGVYTLPDAYTAITSYNSPELVEGGYYLINSIQASNGFLKANDSYSIVDADVSGSVVSGISSFEGISIDEHYVWSLESTGNANEWYITTSGATTYSIGAPSAFHNVPLLPKAKIGSNPYFVFADGNRSTNISMKCSQNNNYLNVNNSGLNGLGGYSGLDNGSSFKFYRLNPVVITARYNNSIVLETIDPMSGLSSPVNTIARNDFINILVSVNFNKDKGDFEFTVKNWNEISGDIDFN